MKELSIPTFPLAGPRLIEASAGTGKTYTIAGLYLRLLLEKKLTVTQILVVTFTEAATQELRGRIRQRLYDALRFVEGKSDSDDFAAMLLSYRDDNEVKQQLRDALTRMDEAAVFTIHGFCQRTLVDSAFESGVLFDSEFVTDESEIRGQIAKDFWRRRVAESDIEYTAWVIKHWNSPDTLFSAVSVLVDNPDIAVSPALHREGLDTLEGHRQELFAAVRKAWPAAEPEITALLNESKLLSRGIKDAFHKDKLAALFAAMPEWLGSNAAPATLPVDFKFLTYSTINNVALHKASESKKGTPAPEHAFFGLAEELAALYAKLDEARAVLFMQEAAGYMRSELALRKERSRILFFDDLLGKLKGALMGEGGAALAARIRQHYPVAMIDEFQDTDPIQYGIFSRVYQGVPECGLFMIGDPKQAIYSFRGADIFTYMQARHDTDAASGHFTLKTNYRSYSTLVEGVNVLFSKSRAPFVYAGEIDFNAVEASGRADETPLRINGEIATPLVCWYVPLTPENSSRNTKNIPKSWAGPQLAHSCAVEIARLLKLGQHGMARIGERNLAAHDIAVLVRDRFEAAYVRDALRALGVASVYISRDSVFNTEEARDLTHLLRAVAEPSHATLLRTALATRLLGLTASDIHRLNNDEIAWETKVLAFQEYHRIWSRNGFMPMFHTLLRSEGVIARLLSVDDGERRMTNLLQLAELAQLASVHHPGSEKLLRWLADERHSADGSAEEQQLRMESDEELVQIVTIHKSKGLEYEVVFLPYLWGSRAVKDSPVVTYHDEQTRILRADLGSEDRASAMALAEKERLAEELRLLYVALTRAKYRCYFSWGQFNGAANSAMAYLLHQRSDDETAETASSMGGLDDAAILRDVESLNVGGNRFIAIEALPCETESFIAQPHLAAPVTALQFTGDCRQSWQMSSFSALASGTSHGKEHRVELPDHDQVVEERAVEVEPEETLSPFTFPRGAQAGLFLHQLLENISFPERDTKMLHDVVTRAMEQYGIDEKWQAVVVSWVAAILDTPLDEHGALRLRTITDNKRLVELEFHFPVAGMDAAAINALLNVQRGEGRQRAELEFASMQGMMKGFIDLIIEHEGRFYVLDYKSNHLGHRLEDYRARQLNRAIDSHYYDLQYLLYILALHRYLKTRLPGYDYEQHIGGVYYLFLRGMAPRNGNATGVYADRPSLALIESLERCFGGMGKEVPSA